MDGYRKGLSGPILDYTLKKCKKHRSIPNDIIERVQGENGDASGDGSPKTMDMWVKNCSLRCDFCVVNRNVTLKKSRTFNILSIYMETETIMLKTNS